MVDDRLPDTAKTEISSMFTNMTDQLENLTSRIVREGDTVHLVEVDQDDDSAIVEITPPPTGDAPIDPVSVVYPRRRRLATISRPGTIDSLSGVSIKRGD